jgi:hypothetical protein
MLFGAPSIRLVERPRRENKSVPTMTELIDELGPVGWLVVEFPGSRFNSEIPLTISPACLTWQNRWTPRAASAVSRAGGQLFVQRSHSVQALLASVEANAAAMELEDEGV